MRQKDQGERVRRGETRREERGQRMNSQRKGEGETKQRAATGEPECKSPVKDACEHAEALDETCRKPAQKAGEGETEH